MFPNYKNILFIIIIIITRQGSRKAISILGLESVATFVQAIYWCLKDHLYKLLQCSQLPETRGLILLPWISGGVLQSSSVAAQSSFWIAAWSLDDAQCCAGSGLCCKRIHAACGSTLPSAMCPSSLKWPRKVGIVKEAPLPSQDLQAGEAHQSHCLIA